MYTVYWVTGGGGGVLYQVTEMFSPNSVFLLIRDKYTQTHGYVHATIVGKSNHASDVIIVEGRMDHDTIVGKTNRASDVIAINGRRGKKVFSNIEYSDCKFVSLKRA